MNSEFCSFSHILDIFITPKCAQDINMYLLSNLQVLIASTQHYFLHSQKSLDRQLFTGTDFVKIRQFFSLRLNPGKAKVTKCHINYRYQFSNSLFSKPTSLNSSIKGRIDSAILEKDHL